MQTGKLKSERHHWWPECVSRLWADKDGGVHWLRPNGKVIRATPDNFGVIGNGHHIKLSRHPGAPSPWDESFEAAFQTADDTFPKVIARLEGLPRAPAIFDRPLAERMISHAPTDEQFAQLIECVISLAVRSPMHRDLAVRTAAGFRGKIEPTERNVLIGLNIRHSLRSALRQIGGRGKALVVFSYSREFIFGDGFFNNLTPPTDHLLSPKLFVPLTPQMAVLFVRPTRFSVEPRLVTLVVSADEVDILNRAVPVYAKEAIYFRSERPAMTDDFAQGKHLIFADHRNPIDQLIYDIPGVPRPEPWLEALLDRAKQ